MQAEKPREGAIIDSTSDHRVLAQAAVDRLGLADLGLLSLGHAVLRKRFEVWREKASYHVLFFSIAGEGFIEDGSRRVAIGPGELVLTQPGFAHRYGSRRLWEKVWFHFQGGKQLPSPPAGDAWIIRKTHGALRLKQVVEGLLWEQNLGQQDGPSALRAYGELLRVYLGRELGPERRALDETRLALTELFARVEQEPGRRWALNDLLPLFPRPVSANHLYKLCVRHHGTPPLRHITRLKMRHAAELLRQTHYPIDRIAALLGYANPFAFSAAFKREMGTCPSAVRGKP